MIEKTSYSKLAKQLVAEGDTVRAKEVINRCLELFPASKLGYDFYFSDIISACFAAGEREKAKEIASGFAGYYYDRAGYILDQRPSVALYAEAEIANGLQMMMQAMRVCFDNGETDLAEELNVKYNELYSRYAGMSQ